MTTPDRTRFDRTRPDSGARPDGRTRPGGRHDRRRPPGGPSVLRRRVPTPHEVFAEKLLAVLSGQRPVHWMLNQTIGPAYQQLVVLAPRTPLRARGTRPVVRRCDAHRMGPGVIEAFARIAAGEQVRAMAFRLEQGADQRWRCAAVEVGGGRVLC
ncbi:Rv3235 family protein [Streptomyces sp. NPDC050504]|uniref:Rv3235 family protein n=1 Tax=Streptomyces sp. NPDC050504 TaxID=3365618 RepID=UPI0037AE5B8B